MQLNILEQVGQGFGLVVPPIERCSEGRIGDPGFGENPCSMKGPGPLSVSFEHVLPVCRFDQLKLGVNGDKRIVRHHVFGARGNVVFESGVTPREQKGTEKKPNERESHRSKVSL